MEAIASRLEALLLVARSYYIILYSRPFFLFFFVSNSDSLQPNSDGLQPKNSGKESHNKRGGVKSKTEDILKCHFNLEYGQ